MTETQVGGVALQAEITESPGPRDIGSVALQVDRTPPVAEVGGAGLTVDLTPTGVDRRVGAAGLMVDLYIPPPQSTRNVPIGGHFSTVRQVPASAALLRTSARSVPISIQLPEIASPWIPAQAVAEAAIVETADVVIPAAPNPWNTTRLWWSESVLVTSSRFVPSDAALSLTSTRTVPLSLAALRTFTRSIPVSGSLTLPLLAAIPIGAVLRATRTRSVAVTARLTLHGERAIAATGVLSSGTLRLVPISTALRTINSRTVPATRRLMVTLARSIPLTGSLGNWREVPLSAAFLIARQRQIPGALRLLHTRQRQISASVRVDRERSVPISAAFRSRRTRQISGTLRLLRTRQRQISASVRLNWERAVPISAAFRGTRSRTIPTSLRAWQTRSRTLPIARWLGNARSVPVGAAWQGTRARSIPATHRALAVRGRFVAISTWFGKGRAVPVGMALSETAERAVLARARWSVSGTTRAVPATTWLGLGRPITLAANFSRLKHRSIGIRRVLVRTSERAVPFGASLGTLRGVPMSLAALSAFKRQVRLSARWLRTYQRTLPVNRSFGLARSVPLHASWQSKLDRRIPNRAAWLGTRFRVLPARVSLDKSRRLIPFAVAAVLMQRRVPLSWSRARIGTRSVPIRLVLGRARYIPASLALTPLRRVPISAQFLIRRRLIPVQVRLKVVHSRSVPTGRVFDYERGVPFGAAFALQPLLETLRDNFPLLDRSKWRVEDDLLEAVGTEVANNQFSFQLTQSIDAVGLARLTTGTAADEVVSGPYRFYRSQMVWRNVSFPEDWGTPGEVEASVVLQGNDPEHEQSIWVRFSDGQVAIGHTDTGVATEDYRGLLETSDPAGASLSSNIHVAPFVVGSMATTSDASATTVATAPVVASETYTWMRIQSTGNSYSIYASADGTTWVLLVSAAISDAMQLAMIETSVHFQLVSSGVDATGSWSIGSINMLPAPSIYLQTEDQGGFAKSALWYQFGPPLDGYREEYEYIRDENGYGNWRDAAGNIHYQWISALCYAEDNPNKVYAMVEDQMSLFFVSSDAGLHWVEKRPSEWNRADAFGRMRGWFECFNIRSPRAGVILALPETPNGPDPDAPWSGVWRSTDDGDSWSLVVAALPQAPGYSQVGNMDISEHKVWWAERRSYTTRTVEPGGGEPTEPRPDRPRWAPSWSGSMDFVFTPGEEYGADEPALDVPPLPEGSEYFVTENVYEQLAEGEEVVLVGTVEVSHSVSMLIVTMTTPGVYAPSLSLESGSALWYQYPPVQNPYTHVPRWDGIYGDIGTVAQDGTWRVMVTPASVTDVDVQAWLDALHTRPTTPLPFPHWFLQSNPAQNPAIMNLLGPHLVTRNIDQPEKVVSGLATSYLPGANEPEWRWQSGDGGNILNAQDISPHYGVSSGRTWMGVIRDWPARYGGKVRAWMVSVRPYPPDSGLYAALQTCSMSGVISAVVMDVVPEDVSMVSPSEETALSRTGRRNPYPTDGLWFNTVGGQWQATGGGPPYWFHTFEMMGPPNRPMLRYEYDAETIATWSFTDFPNVSGWPGG